MILALTAIGFIFLFAIYAGDCLPAAVDAVQLFLTSVLPSVFPFYVCAGLLIQSPSFLKAADRFSPIAEKCFGISGRGAFALLIGFVSGYPAGARITADLYKKGCITEKEAISLSAFTNNCGPLFLIGTVGAGFLGNSRIGFGLWLIHILAALITGFLFRNRTGIKKAAQKNVRPPLFRETKAKSLPARLSEAMTEAMTAMFPIAAAILFFAALTAVLKAMHLFPAGWEWLSGLVEISAGIADLTRSSLSLPKTLCFISIFAGWSGISVHIQVTGILTNAGLPCKKYILGKLCQTAIAAALTLSCVCFLPLH